jgi:hypothetical protein
MVMTKNNNGVYNYDSIKIYSLLFDKMTSLMQNNANPTYFSILINISENYYQSYYTHVACNSSAFKDKDERFKYSIKTLLLFIIIYLNINLFNNTTKKSTHCIMCAFLILTIY